MKSSPPNKQKVAQNISSGQRVLSLAYPVILIVILGLAMLAWSLSDARSRQMEIVTELSEQTMIVTLEEKQKSLNLVLSDYAHWDETLNFTRHLDPDWAKGEIGENLTKPFELAVSLLLDQNGKILWWQRDDLYAQQGISKEDLEKALWQEQVVPRLMNSWQEVPAKPRAAFFRFNGNLYSLHGALVTSDEDGYQPDANDRVALLLLKRIDQSVLDGLSRHKQSTDIHLALFDDTGNPVSHPSLRISKPGVKRAAVPLMNIQGIPLAELSWYPAFTVDHVYDAIGPNILMMLMVISLCFIWYVNRVRAGASLLDQEIQARREAEAELESHKNQLEDLVEVRTEELYEALAKVQAASEEKTRFSSQMSHEMRTPLNAISGFAQLLQEEVTDSEQKDSLAEIIKASGRLTDIVDQALKLTTMEDSLAQGLQGKCDPFFVLAGMYQRYQAQAAQKSVQMLEWGLDQEAMSPIPAETAREVFKVLLENALQYSQPGGQIELKAMFSDDEESLLIKVIDDGIGIPTEKEKLLFQPFSRLHFDLLPNIEGVGLGLFMARKKIRACGGDIRYRPGERGGSCFTVQLPRI
ncbi:ATP-binding protein [Oceanospirillum sanctuarii]|uniref:sensor histidine kinase n=1 Tax=Oceanospirillum sanctuarii TaxID=1434821 RepID=UPI000A3BAC5B|nr:ATP-binding protein [Oceanospirillum sanctuarii]